MYEISYLFFYRPIFMLELLAACLLFMVYLRPRKGFAWKLPLGIACCFGFSFLVPVVSFDAFYCSILFFSMFVVTVVMWCLVIDEPVITVIFCAIAGYTVQHIAHEICELLLVIFNVYGNISFNGAYSSANPLFGDNWMNVIIYIIDMHVFAFVYLAAFLFFRSRMRMRDAMQLKASIMIPLVSFLLLVNVFFSAMGIYSLSAGMNATGKTLLHVFNIASCCTAIILLFELPRRRKAEFDLVMLERLYQRQEQQYHEAKENQEKMNIKYHDIKHLVSGMRERNSINESEVSQIQTLVDSYENTYQTASAALNVVLNEKSAVCRQRSVEFSCIADAAKLGFMSETDIYVLFGNILDNAIEAVCGLDKEKRSIGILINSTGEIIVINVYNGYSGEIKFENGLPVTKKKDKANHGYGLKSIRQIVRQYGGEMRISTKEGLFEITLVFQIPKS